MDTSTITENVRWTALSPDSFWKGLVQSLFVTILTELGDKTFFMAIVMSMRYSRIRVLIGALGGLWMMTLLSVALGVALPSVVDERYTSMAASILFACFGLQMIYEWWQKRTSTEATDELKDTERELNDANTAKQSGVFRVIAKSVVLRTFALTALAEWGDRSQLTTVMLAASRDPRGVAIGGLLGQGLCTCLAVVGGKFLARKIPENLVVLGGGICFLAFALAIAGSRVVNFY